MCKSKLRAYPNHGLILELGRGVMEGEQIIAVCIAVGMYLVVCAGA